MNKGRKRILLVTTEAPASDRKEWSGIPYSLKKELVKYYDVDEFCMMKDNSILLPIKRFYVDYIKSRKSRSVFWNAITGVSSLPDVQNRRASSSDKSIGSIALHLYAVSTAKRLEKALKQNTYDCVVVTHPSGVASFATLDTAVPIILYTDAVISDMYSYYWFGISHSVRKEMDSLFEKGLQKSTRIIVTSDWAARSAKEDYQIGEDKVSIIPFGANLEDQIGDAVEHEGINLLFVGVEWERKGGQIAVDCIRELNRIDRTHHYTLHIAGCDSPYKIEDPNIKIYGFLNRNNESERSLLNRLRSEADLFLLPTRAECSGIVFCEACAYSLPSLTYDTGGISNYVINGENGYRLPLSADGTDFAKKIREIINNGDELSRLKKNALRKYENDLNWETAGRRISEVIDSIG